MPTYIKSLDGLRALAVAVVMMFHFQLLPIGWMGVQIFFVLSGYLITRILIDDKKYPIGYFLKRFYWRRTIRIFPIYFTYLLLIAAAFLVMGTPESGQGKLPYLFTYTYNFTRILPDWSHSPLFTHLWSLSVEEQFYLFWPLFIYLLPEKVLKPAILIIIATGPVIRYVCGTWLASLAVNEEAAGEAIYWFTLSHIDAFAIGAAITLFSLPTKLKASSYLFVLSLVIVVVLGWLNLSSLNAQGHNYQIATLGYSIGALGNLQYVWSYTVLNICFSLLLISLINSESMATLNPLRVFNNLGMVLVGKVSYGMYLYHWAIMAVFYKIASPYLGKGWLAFIAYFIVVFIAAWLSFTFYESLFLKFKDRFFKKNEQITAP